MSSLDVEVRTPIAAPVEIVWDLLTTPGGLTEWLAVDADVDLRPGGTLRYRHDNGWVMAGAVEQVVPMRRLRFSFGWEVGDLPVPPGSTTVTIDLEVVGEGTEVVLRHTGLSVAMAERHRSGWRFFLDRLATVATGGDLSGTSQVPGGAS